jgi:tripartite-type tricarboxylate transporter receptor subunit TctC
MTRVVTFALICLAALATAVVTVRAQATYPERPIRLVIPYPPGGVYDSVGRPWAEKMKPLLGTVVVENMGGAGSSIGTAAVARALPDGYTLLLGGNSGLVINPIATTRPLYDPMKSFDPIVVIGTNPTVIEVHPSLPIKNLKELIAYAKANPGKLSYGSSGVGTPNHLLGELFKMLTETDIAHVPYRGAGLAMTDLISGHIPMNVQSVTGQVLELHRTGKLRVLAVTSPQRLVAAPDIPTAIEEGLPRLTSQGFLAVFAPSGTPKPIIDRIAQATRVAMADPEFQQRFIAAGFDPTLESGPEHARRLLDDEFALWRPVIQTIGLRLD